MNGYAQRAGHLAAEHQVTVNKREKIKFSTTVRQRLAIAAQVDWVGSALLIVMSPHTDNFYSLFILNDLVNQPMLDIYAS